MHFVSQFYGGSGAQFIESASTGTWHLLDASTVQEKAVQFDGGNVTLSSSNPLAAAAQDVLISQTGASISKGVLDRLFDATPGTSVTLSLDSNGFVGNSYNALTIDPETIVVSLANSNGFAVLRKHPTTGEIAEIFSHTVQGVIDLTDFALINEGAQSRFCAVSAQSDAVIGFSLTPDGSVVEDFSIGKSHGLAIDMPNVIKTIVSNGTTYAVVGSYGTDSLSVLSIDDHGNVKICDHIIDDRLMRFSNTSILETATVSGRSFVFAAGNDGGLTMFEMLNDGRLVFFQQWTASSTLDIEHISEIEIINNNSELNIIIKLKYELFIRAYHLDMTALGGATSSDQIIYATGTGTGGNGNDVIVDGAGQDVLTGGSGSDVFVMCSDKTHDTITDFDATLDVIDLSFWSMLYSIDQLAIRYGVEGAEITFGGETLTVQFSRAQLDQHFSADNFRFSAHYSMDLVQENPLTVETDPDPWGIEVLMAHRAGAFTLPIEDPGEPSITTNTVLEKSSYDPFAHFN